MSLNVVSLDSKSPTIIFLT